MSFIHPNVEYRFPRAILAGVALLAVVLLIQHSELIHAQDAGPSAESVQAKATPESVLRTLEQANLLRAEEAKLRDAWEAEAAELRVLIESVKAQREEALQTTRALGEQRGALSLQITSQAEQRKRLASSLEAAEATLANAESRYDQSAELSPTHLFAPRRVDAQSSLADRAATLKLAYITSRQSAHDLRSSIMVSDLLPNGAAVRVLHAGPALAWWITLDGAQAGCIITEHESTRVPSFQSESEITLVREAFRALDEGGASDLVWLPIPRNWPRAFGDPTQGGE